MYVFISPSKHTLEDVRSYQCKYILFFYPQSQHGRIKGSVRGRNGVWPAITYALVIWLCWLWAACCAMLLGLGNIKLIIAIDRQSICQCVELGGWADVYLHHFCSPYAQTSVQPTTSRPGTRKLLGNVFLSQTKYIVYSIYLYPYE